jgi:hypothetical protein
MIKMKIKYIIIAIFAGLLFGVTDSFAKSLFIPAEGKFDSRFLIVIDQKSFRAVKADVLAYKTQLESEGLGAMILAGEWDDPMKLRKEIEVIYKKKPVMEGAVFVGDIPIVRIRNFQHATTAFKMDEEKFPMFESSVTSDRFYDDLDLEFEFLSRDDKFPNLYYYKLKENSPQVVESDFYSARMLPPSDMRLGKYFLLSRYLKKVVAAHKENNTLDKFVVFNGHGYNSDCLTAWQNEQFYMREIVPEAFKVSSGNGFYNYRQDPFMKFKLFEKLQKRGTDLFIFHEHGDFDTQYINGEYPADNIIDFSGDDSTVQFNYANSKFDRAGPLNVLSIELRNMYRKYKGDKRENFKKEVIETLGFTDSFFDPEVLEKSRMSDSTFSANFNICLKDLIAINPEPKFVIFDACYNGSFHMPGYVAGYYVFGEGGTVVAQGNTVNVLQDKWSLELLGILSEGARVGFWQKEFQLLESHLIGDPTYMFRTEGSKILNYNLAVKGGDKVIWEQYLHSNNPSLQAMSLKQLSKANIHGYSDTLLSVVKSSPFCSVRMEALKRLVDINSSNIAEAITIGLSDPYELIRRNAARYAGYSGIASLIEPLVNTVLFSNESQRVQYMAQTSLMVMDPEEVVREIERQLVSNARSVDIENTVKSFKDQYKYQDESLALILDKSAPELKRLAAIRSLRNYNCHRQVDTLLTVLKDSKESLKVRASLAEALGWFRMSYKRPEIVETMNMLVKQSPLPEDLRSEIEQSIIRLKL